MRNEFEFDGKVLGEEIDESELLEMGDDTEEELEDEDEETAEDEDM